ncbi:MAG: AAA family ATPase, partial [Leptolyngbya sp. SIO3F4]|nr:AAA family ATPase [Leptolyngbya sp. SIO3F4]
MNITVKPVTAHKLIGYSFAKPIYQGARTTVYRAVKTATQQSVVLKVLTKKYPSFSELVQFRNQYTILKNLSSPGITSPLGLELLGNSYVLVMEDWGGVSLAEYIEQQSLELSEILDIGLQLTNILHNLFQHRVLHKDINPANILIEPKSKHIKLTDFGIASLLPKETQTIQNPNILEGTLAYLAPEQTGRMNRGIDYRTDFYGLGVTLYQLLSGRLPFTSDDPLELIHCHIAKVPTPVDQVNPDVPAMVAAIVTKLMAKNAEDRYQSTRGLKYDLEHCLTQWQATGSIPTFEPGQQDVCDRFIIPEKLYGREAEVRTLLKSFERIAQGDSELMLVSGFSGIGKTAVINEVQKPIVQRRGYFIKGKFDQFKRDIPFSAFVQAFRELVGQLLSENDASLQTWKHQILEVLGENAQVIIDLIPELESITGPQPVAPDLTGMAAQNRFNLLFQRFIQVFTTPDHPLVIFVDDLQWADSASLNLIQVLMSEAQTSHLLLVGAYRDNEVSPTHPLMITLKAIGKGEVAIHTINLQSLKTADLNQLITDTLRAPAQTVQPLTKLVMQKTQGNPFFATQFLNVLHQDQLISFDYDAGHWQCDMVRVQAAALTDDVIELMASRLKKLPEITQEILKLAACIGAQFDLETLAIVLEKSQADVATALWKALQERIILPQSDVYKFYLEIDNSAQSDIEQTNLSYHFLHDRVQQAAYSLIPDSQRSATHLSLGRRLLINSSEPELDDNIFDIVNHYNRGLERITTPSERDQLCQLNRKAAVKAKRATAYETAYEYALSGVKLLSPDGWQSQYSLMLTLHELASESAYLKGDFETSQQWSKTILDHAQTTLDEVNAHEINLLIYVAQGQSSQAIAIGQHILERLGIPIPTMPTIAECQQSWAEVSALMPADQSAQSLLDLPSMTDSLALAALQILNSMAATVYLTQPQLFPLIVLAQVKLSLLHGNTPVSAGAYARYSFMLCSKHNNISLGYEFGQLALSLSERFSNKEISTRVLLMVGALTIPWKVHLKESIPLLQRAYQNGLESGNLDGAALSHFYESQSSYLMGEELQDLAHKIAAYSAQIKQIKQEFHFGNNELLRQVILNLTTSTEIPCALIGEAFNENEMLPIYQSSSNLLGLYCLYLHKAILGYWFSRKEDSLEYITTAANYQVAATSQATVPLLHFYDSLIRLALYNTSSASEKTFILTQVNDNQKKLEFWATYAPMNFQHKYELVLAAKYHCLGQTMEAIEAFDHAISGAKRNGYLQEEALANELAAQFYLDWGKERVAADYMQEAYYCYTCWGATSKVADLEAHYRELLRPILQSSASSGGNVLNTLMTIAAPTLSIHTDTQPNKINIGLNNHTFDFASILKASQALSSTIQLDDLLCQLTQIILQNSGGDSCALIIPNETGLWQVRAVATSAGNPQLCTATLTSNSNLPVKLIQYVKNTQKVVVIENLETDLPVIDDYLIEHQPKSLLCLPLLNQGHLIGILYLKNQLTSGVFTSDRITILNFLCAQTAISLENARLYQLERRRADQLAASEKRLQTLFDQAADAVFLLEEQKIIDCNQAAISLLCYPNKTELLDLQLEQFSPERQPDGQLSAVKIKCMLLEASQRCSLRFEWVYQRYGGENFWA